MKKLFVLLWACLTGIAGWAQDPGDARNDRIQSLKIAFITDKLNLTTKEAEGFWPVYNEFDAQLKKIRQNQREAAKIFMIKSTPTDAECDKFISDQLTARQAEADLLKKYTVEFKKVLPIKKVAVLLTLEQEFKQQLLKRMQDKRKEGR